MGNTDIAQSTQSVILLVIVTLVDFNTLNDVRRLYSSLRFIAFPAVFSVDFSVFSVMRYP
ncbi:MAG: hypothetical protein ACM3TR_02590 [Caulobacteraceae bacterium]